MVLNIILPDPSKAHVLSFIRDVLELSTPPIVLQITPESGCGPGDCFINVRRKTIACGGTMQTGWALWERPGVYIEAEHHAVYDSGSGSSLLDITPCPDGFRKRLFVADPDATFDFDGWRLRDNRRMALIDDDLIDELFKASSRMNTFKANLPGRGTYTLSQSEQKELAKLQRRYIRANQDFEAKYGSPL
jgi:hypothetical protein